MVKASPFIHEPDRVVRKASEVSAADWRYQTHVKKYDACKLIGGQILCSGWCTPLQGHVYPYFQKIPSLTNSFLQKSLSEACLCTVNNFLTLYSSNLTKILFLQRNFSKDNFKNI